MLRRIAALVAASALAGAGLVFGASAASAASADAFIYATYPVNGSTTIKSTSSTMALGPGTLQAALDVSTDAITANMTLPEATGSFNALGFVPVTATTAFVQDGAITGKDVSGAFTGTANITIKLTDVKVAGIDVPVGDNCQTKTPAVINLNSGTGFNVLTGGPVSGTYSIPDFDGCGLITTPLLNLLIPGDGNTITLTLGKPTVSVNPPTSS